MNKKVNLIHVLFVPFLLCAVAITQQILAHTKNLSPWLGGGFGMFSTVEGPGSRQVRIVLDTTRGEYIVDIPESLKDLQAAARTMPTDANLKKLAEVMLAEKWVGAVPTTNDSLGRFMTNATSMGFENIDEEMQFAKVANGDLTEQTLDVRSANVDLWQSSFNSNREAFTTKHVKSISITKYLRKPSE